LAKIKRDELKPQNMKINSMFREYNRERERERERNLDEMTEEFK